MLGLVGTRFGIELWVSLEPSPLVYVLTSVIETAVVARERRLPLTFPFVPCEVGGREDRKEVSLGLGGSGGRSSRGLACPSSWDSSIVGTDASVRLSCSSSVILFIIF